jgi:pyruvate-formate lyase-activating enzyme
MGLYHITYIPELDEVCIYFDGGCNLRCHGCITDHHPEDCHLDERVGGKNPHLSTDEAISKIEPLSFKRVLFLGKEPTMDDDFPELAHSIKERFSSHNVLLTNGCIFWDREVDEVCVSIKAITRDIFREFTGSDCVDLVINNFRRYSKNNIILRAESLYVPKLIDMDEIEGIAAFISTVDPCIPYRIDAYIPHKGDRFRRPTKEEMEMAKEVAKRYLRNVEVLYQGMRVRYRVERIY